MNNLKKLLAAIVVVAMMVMIMVPAFAASPAYSYSAEAQVLNDLGLYKGISDTSFDPDLGTALDRETGVVMLLRIFGLEDQALAISDADSVLAKFSDAGSIAAWAKNQVAYAVENGLVAGYPDGTFGPTAALNGKAYCTLIMRQLGFTPDYDNAPAELAEKGGLDPAEAVKFTSKDLVKDDLVGISYGSLKASDKDGNKVIDSLVASGVVQEDAAVDAGLVAPAATPTPTPVPAVALDVASAKAINSTTAELTLNTAATDADVAAATVAVAERDSSKDLAVKSVALAAWDTASKTVTVTTDPQVGNTIYKITVGSNSFNFVGKGADTTAPKLTAATATNNTTVELTFDKLMDGATGLDPASYSIVKKSGTGSNLTITSAAFGDTRKTVDLTVSSMTSGTVYTVTVSAKDASLNAIDSSNNAKDFGGKGKDTTAPGYVNVTATANNTVEVLFDRKLDLATAQDISNYTIVKKTGSGTDIKVLAATLDTADSTTATYYKKVTLTTESQTSGTVYTLTVKNLANYDGKVVDSAGITHDFGGRAKDTTAPGFANVTATANNTVEVTFDRKLDQASAESIANYTITKKTGSGKDIAVLAAALDTDSTDVAGYLKKVTLTTESQAQGTVYTLKVINVSNIDGKALDTTGITRDFGGRAKDTTAPTIVSLTPAYDAVAGEYSVMVKFSDKMDKATAEDPINYSISSSLGYAVTATLQDDTTQVKLVTATMTLGKSYTVTFNNVKNSDGVVIAANATATFTGVAPTTAGKPTISGVSCNNSTELVITFDKNVDQGTANTPTNYEILKGSNVFANNGNFKVKRDEVNNNVVYLTLTNKTFGPSDILELRTKLIEDANGLNPQDNGFTSDFSCTFGSNDAAADALSVSAVTPIDSQTIKVLFNKMIEDSVTTTDKNNYALKADDVTKAVIANGNPSTVILTKTGDNAYKEVTLKFAANVMHEGYIYNLVTKSVKDYVGVNAICAAFATTTDGVGFASFSAAGGDPAGLQILSILPVDNQTIDIAFNTALDFDAAATTLATNYVIKTENNGAFATAQHVMKIDDTTVRVYLKGKTYTDGTIYAVAINDNVKGAMGEAFTTQGGASGDDDYATFSALGDANPAPKITGVTLLNKNILVVDFSETVAGLTGAKTNGHGNGALAEANWQVNLSDGSQAPGFGKDQNPTLAEEASSTSVKLTFDQDFMAGKTYKLLAVDKAINDAADVDNITTTDDANFIVFDGMVGGAIVSRGTACATPGVTKSVTGAVLSDIIKVVVVGEPLSDTTVAVKTTLTATQATELKNLALYEVASDGTGAAIVSDKLTDATLTAGYLTFTFAANITVGTHYYVIEGDTAAAVTDGSVKFEVEAGKVAYTGATTGIATVSVGADAGTAVVVDATAPTAIAISAQDTVGKGASVTLTATNGPLSDASWTAILTQIQANTNAGANWITGAGITASDLTITPAADGVTATLNDTDAGNDATMAADFAIDAANVVDRAGNVAAGVITIDSKS